MHVRSAAHHGTFDEFAEAYSPGDENRLFDDRGLLFEAATNNNPAARYAISSFLLDRDCTVDGIGSEKSGLFVLLFSRRDQVVSETLELAQRLVDRGVDPTVRDVNGQDATYWLNEFEQTDEELGALYDLWFSLELDLVTADKYGETALDAAIAVRRHPELARRIEQYLARD